MTSKEENVFVTEDTVCWNGPWMKHVYPMEPPTILYFRISNCGKHRQYHLRYLNEDGTESLWENNFEPFPNDNHLKGLEKDAIEMYNEKLKNKKTSE